MEITHATLDAVYTLIYLYLQPSGQVVDLHKLSDTLDVPHSYMSKVLQQLQRSGYLASQMGSKGGYRLTKNVEQTTMRDVVMAMQGETMLQECLSDHFICGRFKKCSVLRHVREIQQTVNRMLDQMTIGQLATEMEFNEQRKVLGPVSLGVQ